MRQWIISIIAVYQILFIGNLLAAEKQTTTLNQNRFDFGVKYLMTPYGVTWHSTSSVPKRKTQLDLSMGLSTFADWRIMKYFSVGIGVDILFDLFWKGKDEGSLSDLQSRLYNFYLRLIGQYDFEKNITLYSVISPGYSLYHEWLHSFSKNQDGFILGFFGGIKYRLLKHLGLVAEIGYQLGFQHYSFKADIENIQTATATFIDHGIDLLMLSLGIQLMI